MRLRLIPKSLDPWGLINFMLLGLIAAAALTVILVLLFAVAALIEAFR